MDGSEIRFQINQINEQLESELNKFILTDKIQKLMAQKEELQHLCHHKFSNGSCVYCDFKETNL